MGTGFRIKQENQKMSEQDGANHTGATCAPSRPCHRWRTCARCARRRQAQIADAVERLTNETGQLRWHILYPHTLGQAELRKVRTDWLKEAAPEGAVWTIEQSKKTGALHCNIITPASITHIPRAANHWQQIIQGDVRAVGAYIGKRSQMPRSEDYSGRLYGTSGQLWQILASQKQYPVVAAAATQFAIDSHAMIEHAASLRLSQSQLNERKWAHLKREKIAAAIMPMEEARRIAAKWLPDLLIWKEKNRTKSSLEIAQEFCQREGT